jgi:dTDP-4-amino-4,6-dideoxygalactose transaminase
MHYGGVACNMKEISSLAKSHSIPIIEDAAHCINAYDRGNHLGTIGDLGTLSFHASKNVHCGEGGALLINNPKYLERAITIREKGTNKKAFYAGKVDKYSWVDLGSSYLMSEITAAFLFAQLQTLKEVTEKRKEIWNTYFKGLKGKRKTSSGKEHNAHIFYLICKDKEERKRLSFQLKERSISTAHHYIPLHSSRAGKKYGQFYGVDRYTPDLSERILRLPIYYSLENPSQIVEIISKYLV